MLEICRLVVEGLSKMTHEDTQRPEMEDSVYLKVLLPM